jgi:RNA polymerase sigma factor (sigma-70 family)
VFPDREVVSRDFRDFVWANVDRLPPDQAEAIRLHFADGLKVSEIARRRGCASSSVTRLIARGLRGLQKLFDSHLG